MRATPPIVFVGLLLAPCAALAAKVAILPVAYAQLDAGAPAAEAARQVEDKVAEGAAQAGYEVLRGQAVADAARAAPACAAARDRACLEAVAAALGADDAIAVAVTDDDHASYEVELLFARRDRVVDERTAGFFVVLEWVRGTVAITLQKPAAAAPGPAAEQPSQPSQPPQPSPPSQESPPSRSQSPRPAPLPRAVFWTGVGVTGALLVAFAATDIAVNVRYNDLKDKSPAARSESDWDAAQRLQVADRALLGVTLAAAAATTVIYFFTDFGDGDEDPSPEGGAPSAPPPSQKGAGGISSARAGGITAVAPVPLPNGGGLVLEGRF